MKTPLLILLVCALVGCISQRPSVYEVGRREAVRLRQSHARWLAERPRKFDMMDVPAALLSKAAREAGFRDGGVDSQIVLLSTAQTDDGTEGLIFGRPSSAEVEGLKSFGFTLESTGVTDVFRFKAKANTKPAP